MKVLKAKPQTPVDSAKLDEDPYGIKKFLHDLEEHVKRFSEEHQEQLKADKEIARQLLAKMRDIQELDELHPLVKERFIAQYDKYRELSREQKHQVLKQLYIEIKNERDKHACQTQEHSKTNE
jgi:hemoglobin-like flavoprotein